MKSSIIKKVYTLKRLKLILKVTIKHRISLKNIQPQSNQDTSDCNLRVSGEIAGFKLS